MKIRYHPTTAATATACFCLCIAEYLVDRASAFPVPGNARQVHNVPTFQSALAAASKIEHVLNDEYSYEYDDDDNEVIESTSRRELFSSALAAASALSILSIDMSSPQSAIAADGDSSSSPTRLSATWSATSGLNSLDPSDPNFVSFDASAYAAMKNDATR